MESGRGSSRRPSVMPANAGIQDTTTLTEFRLLALPPGASLAPPRRVPLEFAGMTKRDTGDTPSNTKLTRKARWKGPKE